MSEQVTHPVALAEDPGVAAIQQLVGTVAGEAFGLATRIAAEVTEVFGRQEAVRRTDLAGVGALVLPGLADPDGRIQGAGYVAAVDALADSRWWLEWFMLRNGTPERLVVDTDPRGENFYDYESLPWYDVPRGTGRRHITGPYVDYLCTDDYTLTFTVPIHHGDEFVGVAGADLKVFTFEKAVLPCLRAAGRTMAIVNAQGRVVLSNSARHVSGTLLKATSTTYEIEDLPLRLVDL
ncbi:cache domain-containing protein [Streptomyces sp. SID13031]|uniref:cache domain-containing protein n=1 Tax=Streptomyces sp. SID13031 TaxID=2706046 RepID=UPI0013C91AD0|nr:cache domain-containing protein [Streptomyces sp. SID13031]NEA31197.1 hypothetical protein [Streptomyces sp. SID13031]